MDARNASVAAEPCPLLLTERATRGG